MSKIKVLSKIEFLDKNQTSRIVWFEIILQSCSFYFSFSLEKPDKVANFGHLFHPCLRSLKCTQVQFLYKKTKLLHAIMQLQKNTQNLWGHTINGQRKGQKSESLFSINKIKKIQSIEFHSFQLRDVFCDQYDFCD